nr:hypothetical protein [Tanacetum cinerariifolium]
VTGYTYILGMEIVGGDHGYTAPIVLQPAETKVNDRENHSDPVIAEEKGKMGSQTVRSVILAGEPSSSGFKRKRTVQQSPTRENRTSCTQPASTVRMQTRRASNARNLRMRTQAALSPKSSVFLIFRITALSGSKRKGRAEILNQELGIERRSLSRPVKEMLTDRE